MGGLENGRISEAREVTGLNEFYASRLEQEGFGYLRQLLDPHETVEFLRVLGDASIPMLKDAVLGQVERFSGINVGMDIIQPHQLFGIYGRSAENSNKLALTETGEILRRFLVKNKHYRLCVVHGLAMQAGNFRPKARSRFFPEENAFSPTAIFVAQQMDKDPYALRALQETADKEDYHFTPPQGDIDLCVFTDDPEASFEKLASLFREATEGVPSARVVVVDSVRQPGFRRVQIETQGITLPSPPEDVGISNREAFRARQEAKTRIPLVQVVPPRDVLGNFKIGLSLPYLIMSGGTVPNFIDLVPYPDGKNIVGFSYNFFNFGKLPEVRYRQPNFVIDPKSYYRDWFKYHYEVEKCVWYVWPDIAFPRQNFPQRYYDALYGFRGLWPFGYIPILGNPLRIGENISKDKVKELARRTALWFYRNVWWQARTNSELLGASFDQRRSNAEKTLNAVVHGLDVNPHSSAVRYLLEPGEVDPDNPHSPVFGMGIASAIHPRLDLFLDDDTRRKIIRQMWADSAWQIHTAGRCNICRKVEAFRQGYVIGEEYPFGDGFLDFNLFLEEKVGLLDPDILEEEMDRKLVYVNSLFRASFL